VICIWLSKYNQDRRLTPALPNPGARLNVQLDFHLLPVLADLLIGPVGFNNVENDKKKSKQMCAFYEQP